MRKTQYEEMTQLFLKEAKRLGYNPNTNITVYQYNWHGHFEVLQVEGCKQIDPMELLRLKFKYDRSYIYHIKKVLGVK